MNQLIIYRISIATITTSVQNHLQARNVHHDVKHHDVILIKTESPMLSTKEIIITNSSFHNTESISTTYITQIFRPKGQQVSSVSKPRNVYLVYGYATFRNQLKLIDFNWVIVRIMSWWVSNFDYRWRWFWNQLRGSSKNDARTETNYSKCGRSWKSL